MYHCKWKSPVAYPCLEVRGRKLLEIPWPPGIIITGNPPENPQPFPGKSPYDPGGQDEWLQLTTALLGFQMFLLFLHKPYAQPEALSVCFVHPSVIPAVEFDLYMLQFLQKMSFFNKFLFLAEKKLTHFLQNVIHVFDWIHAFNSGWFPSRTCSMFYKSLNNILVLFGIFLPYLPITKLF